MLRMKNKKSDSDLDDSLIRGSLSINPRTNRFGFPISDLSREIRCDVFQCTTRKMDVKRNVHRLLYFILFFFPSLFCSSREEGNASLLPLPLRLPELELGLEGGAERKRAMKPFSVGAAAPPSPVGVVSHLLFTILLQSGRSRHN